MINFTEFLYFLDKCKVKYETKTNKFIEITIENHNPRNLDGHDGYGGFFTRWSFDKKTGELVSIANWE